MTTREQINVWLNVLSGLFIGAFLSHLILLVLRWQLADEDQEPDDLDPDEETTDA
jgi:hypothetical protein